MGVRGWSPEREAKAMRKIVELRDIHRLSFPTIASRFGIHDSIASELYRRAKAALAVRMDQPCKNGQPYVAPDGSCLRCGAYQGVACRGSETTHGGPP